MEAVLDHVDRSRLPEELDEPLGMQQIGIGAPTGCSEFVDERLEVMRSEALRRRADQRPGAARHQLLEVVLGGDSVGVLLGDGLALFGEANGAVERSGG